MTTFAQPTTRSLSPQVLLIHHETLGALKMYHFPDGVILTGGYFNVFTGKLEREHQITLHGDVTIYLAKSSKFPNWCYIQLWDNKAQQFRCSCYEKKSCGDCSHCSALEGLDSLLG